MLLKFKHIRSREAINRQMMMKFNDILAQYYKEVTGRGTHGYPGSDRVATAQPRDIPSKM
jgi:hypothetical protein